MKHFSKAILILIFALVVLSQDPNEQQNPDIKIQTFQVGQTIVSKATNRKVFSAIQVKQLKSKYFFVHLQADIDSKNVPLKMYIYLEGNPNPLKVCQDQQIDSCYLSKDQMQANKNLLVLISSDQNQYGFSIRTYWSDVEHLLPNSQTKFYFSKQDQTQFYHLELNDTNFHELRIIIKPETIRSAFDKIKIYGSFGKDSQPSRNTYDFKSMHLWQDAQGIFLYGKQIKDKNIQIFLEGEIETVYTLSCEVVQKSHHDLTSGQTVHQYLQPGEDFNYHAKFVQNQSKKVEFDEYVLTFSGFSGKLNLGFYLDEQKKHPLDIQPFEYLSDAQYVFKKRDVQQKMKQGLYLYVHALQRKSIYTISFYGRNKTVAIRLSQNIYEFLQVDKQSQQLTYFQIFQWINDTRQGDLQYSISLTNVVGEHQLEFRTCLKTFDQCTNPSTYSKATQVQNAVVTTIGTKKNFLISFSRQSLQKFNIVEKYITVLVIVKNSNKQKKNSLAAIEYRPQNRLHFLREGKPIESRIKQDQYKVFKYTNQDPFLKEIKVYLTEISGKVDVFSLREQPQPNKPYGKQQTNSVISFTKELSSKPIFIVVQGKQEAIFSIQIVSIHKSDQSLSSLTLTEDLSFSLRVKPQGSQVVEVVPIFSAIYFQYIATGSILVCAVNQATGDCQSDYKPKLSKKGEINFQKFSDRSEMFKILNPSQTQNVRVTVVYHSKDYAHCEQKQIGTLYYETIQKDQIAEQGFQNNCFSLAIMQKKDVSFTLSRVDLGEIHYAVALCNILERSQSQTSFGNLRIPYGKIAKACQNETQKVITLMVSPHKQLNEQNKVIIPSKIKYIFEYSDEKVITIPDGVAYDFEAKTTQSPVKIFYYDLLNKKNTTIKLVQYSGYGTFSVHIVPTGNKQSQIESTTYDHSFSKSDSYFLNPSLTLKKQDFQNKICEECSLIIKVYSVEEIGTKVHFGLEVTQNHNQLEDHRPKDGFLTKNSLDFYSFTTLDSKLQGSLIIQINDNNRRCSKIYLSDLDYPDEKNYIAKEQGNQLIYKDVEPEQTYYISVEAVEDCPYSITVSNTKTQLTKLRRGSNSPLSLKKGEVKFFMIEHLQKKQFKILSILQYGQTQFYMNRTSSKDIEAFLSKQASNIKYDKFEVKSDYINRIVLHQNNSYLVQNSYYLIAVIGKTQTQGFLFYGDSDTSIQILSDTVINDQLSVKGQMFRGEYYGDGNITLQVTVLTGQLNVHVKKPQQEKQFDKNYTQSKTSYQSKFQIKSSKQSYFLRDPAQVSFTSLKSPTVYSFKFIRKIENEEKIKPNVSQFHVRAGYPNYFNFLSKSVKTTISGTLTHGQELFISTKIDSKQKLAKLEFKSVVQGAQVPLNFTTSIVRNMMKIEFVNVSSDAIDYKLLVNVTEDMDVIVNQNSGLNLVSADTEVLVQGENDYVLYPEESVLLDVFECQGNADILYSNSKSALDSLESKSLDLIGMPNQPHAIKILNPGTTFLRVKSTRSYFRWLPMNSEKGKGMGYLDYDIGGISYTGSLLKLTVQWDSVFAKRDTKTRIISVEYVLIVGANASAVKDAMNCENYKSQNILYYRYNTGQSNIRSVLEIDLSKSEITEKYSQDQNLFIGIVGEVTLQVPNETLEKNEHYRFVYHVQEVPLQVFKDMSVASRDIWIIVLIIAGAVFLFSVTVFIFVTKVAPIISRLKNGNVMVQENKEEKQFDIIPPSSDRNQVNNNLESEEGMK